jgi:hypothetical protein
MSFEEANKKVHKVEDQWHYPILTNHGFVPVDKEKVGFVRSYRYEKGDHVIVCNTGASADYFSVKQGPKANGCYWGDLEPYLKSIAEKASA